MNEELQKQLAALLAGLLNVAGDAAKFAGNQIPPLVQEKIVFGRVTETIELAVGIVALVWCVRVFRAAWTLNQSVKHSGADLWFETRGAGVCIISGLGAGVSILWSLITMEATAMVWFAPRLYIVEWLKGMVTK